MLSAGRIRQQHGPNSNPSSRQKSSRAGGGSAISRALQRFDLYANVDEDLQVKTGTGAAVTIGFWLVMVLLVYGEVVAHLRVMPATERLVVDSTIGQKLRINTNIVSLTTTIINSLCSPFLVEFGCAGYRPVERVVSTDS